MDKYGLDKNHVPSNSSMAENIEEMKHLGNQIERMRTGQELMEVNKYPDPIQTEEEDEVDASGQTQAEQLMAITSQLDERSETKEYTEHKNSPFIDSLEDDNDRGVDVKLEEVKSKRRLLDGNF